MQNNLGCISFEGGGQIMNTTNYRNIISQKERLITPKRIVAINVKNGKTIWLTNKIFPQHFYPLSIKDYCEAVKVAVKSGIDRMPILSVSSKDFPYCDFKCLDCLACPSREWAVADNHIKYPIIPIELYKKILDEISRYSKERGYEHVRFEICGEGNPDLYKDRVEMIEYATKNCGMKIVYVSTGSKMNEELIDCLVRNSFCIRISFPGITPTAYDVYSNQRNWLFGYEEAISLLKKLTEKRKEYGREGELLIGARTCIRPLNDGSYKKFLATIGELGVDAFQAVKVLTPEFGKHLEQTMSREVVKELLELKENYKELGIQDFQIPNDLNKIYNDRSLRDEMKPSKCWSSMVSPPLYGTNLMCCVLWDRITDLSYHYGIMEGEIGELENMMTGANARYIKENCPKNCKDCCSYNDNKFMESLWKILKVQDDVDDIEFFFEY